MVTLEELTEAIKEAQSTLIQYLKGKDWGEIRNNVGIWCSYNYYRYPTRDRVINDIALFLEHLVFAGIKYEFKSYKNQLVMLECNSSREMWIEEIAIIKTQRVVPDERHKDVFYYKPIYFKFSDDLALRLYNRLKGEYDRASEQVVRSKDFLAKLKARNITLEDFQSLYYAYNKDCECIKQIYAMQKENK